MTASQARQLIFEAGGRTILKCEPLALVPGDLAQARRAAGWTRAGAAWESPAGLQLLAVESPRVQLRLKGGREATSVGNSAVA